jgi:transcriptional regulator with GAF, ATPase, and Fis domain
MRAVLTEFNLAAAERLLVVEALATAGSIVEAAQLLGVTRAKVKRLIIKHRIEWPRAPSPSPSR